MEDTFNLLGSLKKQDRFYTIALAEIKNGQKSSHWMWYIFMQQKGLGRSNTSTFYTIENIEEAQAYLNHPVLGKRIKEISNALLLLDSDNTENIFGDIDNKKLKSSMTLFSSVPEPPKVFEQVLIKYFNGRKSY